MKFLLHSMLMQGIECPNAVRVLNAKRQQQQIGRKMSTMDLTAGVTSECLMMSRMMETLEQKNSTLHRENEALLSRYERLSNELEQLATTFKKTMQWIRTQ